MTASSDDSFPHPLMRLRRPTTDPIIQSPRNESGNVSGGFARTDHAHTAPPPNYLHQNHETKRERSG